MAKIIKLMFVIVCAIGISGCAGLNRALELQNDYASSFSVSSSGRLHIEREYTPSVTRGISPTTFSAFIPAGWYIPIADSDGRTFYQAPDGFEYRAGDNVESRIGGLVQIKAGGNSEFYVWLFPNQADYFEVQPNGTWIEDVEPGLFNVPARPWVEGDLRVEIVKASRDTGI